MKKSRSILLILLSAVFALCVFAFTACAPEDQGGGDTEVKVTVAPATLSLTVGGATGNLEATVENSTETVTWSSNKTNIATVTADATNGNKAVVTAVAAGEAVITAKVGDKSATCRVTVEAKQVTLSLSKTTTSIAEGKTEELTATYDGTGTLTYTIDKTNIATVEKNSTDQKKAVISAVAPGTATLTVSDGEKTATCEITVTEIPEVITFNDGDNEVTKVYLHAEDEATLTATGSKGSTITGWESSDPTVATVENGKITAVKIGFALITAKVSDSVKGVIPVWVSPEDYTVENGEEKDDMARDQWIEWHWQDGWGGPVVVTMTEHKFADNAATLTYTAVGGNSDFGVQFFYKNSEISTYDYYMVTALITSAIDTKVKFNGVVSQLEAGVPTYVTASYVESNKASISIQVDVNGEDENTISVGDVVFNKLPQVALTAPSFSLAGDDNTITIEPVTAEEEKIAKYEVGLFENADDKKPAHIIAVTDGQPVPTDGLPEGNYTVKLRAIPTNLTEDGASPWSTTGADISLADTGRTLVCDSSRGEGNAKSDPGEWYIYSANDAVDTAKLFKGEAGTLGTIVLNHTTEGTEWYSTQIFMECNGVTNGTNYALSMTIRSTVAATITVGGQVIELEADTDYTINPPITKTEDDGASIVIVLGKFEGTVKAPVGTYTFSNIKYEAVVADGD